MNVSIVTCYESNEERVRFVSETCINKNYNVEVITTDFSHIKKTKRNNIPENYKVIETKPYSKNLSIKRMASHKQFAVDVFKYLDDKNVDIIWVMIPGNYLVKEAKRYKDRHSNIKIIFDVIDMWPESLPISLNKNIFPFNIWRNIRSKYLNCADYLVTECNLYMDILKNEYKGKHKTIYWAKEPNHIVNNKKLDDSKLSLCYIGSINHIIDVDKIKEIIQSIKDKEVVLHVIGEGESVEYFINELNNICELIYHGAIRDPKQKAEIFDMCHAGINIYKDNLYIGLTVKCLDYFENGLPIINNIKGDTYRFVEDYGVGINYDSQINSNELINMSHNNQNVYDLFNNSFTKEVFMKNCSDVLDEVLK